MDLTPKEKAKEIYRRMVKKHINFQNPQMIIFGLSFCKDFSLSVVDEIILFYERKNFLYRKKLKYWKEVKQEIKKL